MQPMTLPQARQFAGRQLSLLNRSGTLIPAAGPQIPGYSRQLEYIFAYHRLRHQQTQAQEDSFTALES
jgi:hypothetical protein